MTAAPIPFVKGHGTGNDFVILPDAGPAVSAQLVAALCDRRRGIGADGVLVVARTGEHPEVAQLSDEAPWFMDYRNADGSVAQMCGNGARVFAAHLVEAGLAPLGTFRIATRGGVRQVDVTPGGVRVAMGPATFMEREDIMVSTGAGGRRPAVGVLLPNPHAVTWVADVAQAGPLVDAPEVTPAQAYPQGTNVEFVEVLDPGRIRMRVFERGVGETLSCGTGACAAAVATARRDGGGPDGREIVVEVPGGVLGVGWRRDGEVELSGPAVLVARGTIDRGWWDEHA